MSISQMLKSSQLRSSVLRNRNSISTLVITTRSFRSMPVRWNRQQEISNSSEEEYSNLLKYKEYYNELRDTTNNVSNEVAEKSPLLNTLHKRLNLPKEFELSLLSRCLSCRSSKLSHELSNPKSGLAFVNSVNTNNYFDNFGLNIFGKNLLTFHVTHHLLQKYPRLPTVVLNAAVDAYISEKVLASIGKSWGIETENTSVLDRFTRNEPINITLGKLRFMNNSLNKEDGIEYVSGQLQSSDAAYALAVRSIIATLWASTQKTQPDLVIKFINDNILSRKLDITRMFQFENPTRELATLCRREGFEQPISRLLAESGRLSKAPVFIIGVFSGNEKLGEGFGSSLKEAKARAATDALMKWYCYEPTSGQNPVIDHGTVIV
ncbi:hypothetical protein Kpol_1064p1 [Vanderwaltozyma polyspora DSM 70294]|uniref:Large ribosomal subunit protein mL44 n=1 Tax=Vanderwaltozyma polyspora (strain ATCC 22028 / DSM 70294 / BCRC 21397 / CBS 2163 / NBRC 10782 / NRRL Y-8283 / UCD 57-17) TaxID=436907 RepID=A7TMC7_VANPO|nr:uncharacterized protein Kpol_1064p1 [Vanderwaltozyma polyspora DSM 70294]EDO16521.1 hypothetical protein Kpol_1064p1 [Vanderwaltozyma polyspora DSM 70294]